MSGRHRLLQGKYVIVACTDEPNNECDFLLRTKSQRSLLLECVLPTLHTL